MHSLVLDLCKAVRARTGKPDKVVFVKKFGAKVMVVAASLQGGKVASGGRGSRRWFRCN